MSDKALAGASDGRGSSELKRLARLHGVIRICGVRVRWKVLVARGAWNLLILSVFQDIGKEIDSRL